MKRLRRHLFAGVIYLPLTLLAGVLFFGTPAVYASSCHSSNSGESGGGHSEHTGAAKQSDVKRVSSTTGLSVDAKVVSVNKADGTVSVVLDLPLQGKSLDSLAGVKRGDPVKLTLVADKTGKWIVTTVSTASKTATLKITGIQCQACADRLQESLQTVPGVSSAAVTANPAQAVVAYDPSGTTVDALKDAIRNTEPIHPGMPFGVKE